jgi:hypothetical protein
MLKVISGMMNSRYKGMVWSSEVRTNRIIIKSRIAMTRLTNKATLRWVAFFMKADYKNR